MKNLLDIQCSIIFYQNKYSKLEEQQVQALCFCVTVMKNISRCYQYLILEALYIILYSKAQ
jgi:hypothetical protein